MKAFNDIADFSAQEIGELLKLAARLDRQPEPEALNGKVLAGTMLLSNGVLR